MKISFDYSEVNALSAALKKAGPRAKKLGSAVVRKTAKDIERDAKILAPVDTGNLKGSVSTTISDDGLSAEIGPTAEYGIYQEFGTSTQPGKPFLGPATDRNTASFHQAVAQIPEKTL